jgi:hypothetical protein
MSAEIIPFRWPLPTHIGGKPVPAPPRPPAPVPTNCPPRQKRDRHLEFLLDQLAADVGLDRSQFPPWPP